MEVAVLITNYNHQDYIVECLNSVKNQTFQNFNVYIIDDCSDDNSVNLINNFIENDDKFSLFINNINIGKSKSLNKLIDIVKKDKPKYIALLDSDDKWYEKKLELQIEYLLKNNDFSVCYTQGELLYGSSYSQKTWGKNKRKLFSDIHFNPSKRQGYIFEELLKGNFICYSTLLLKSKIFETIEFNNIITRSMDWLFLVLVSQKYKFGYISNPLVYYRIHQKNLQVTVNKTNEVLLPRIFILGKYKKYMSRKTIANHNYALARKVLDVNYKYKTIDFFIFYFSGLFFLPIIKKLVKLPINLLKSYVS